MVKEVNEFCKKLKNILTMEQKGEVDKSKERRMDEKIGDTETKRSLVQGPKVSETTCLL